MKQVDSHLAGRRSHADAVAWSYDMATKRESGNERRVSTSCVDDHQFRDEAQEAVGELSSLVHTSS